ncbi:hypothetical protein J437_LFUL014153 [Ladona fulva]|uniref:Uncharacterized protein n=1 Tax=Ladona fulva TaxID=123851 RepID=A0A8K0P940_LADFU|nr:hypothetical protein J437_LFUL014153 [Ladona fulva]
MNWELVVDKTREVCRSWQTLRFERRPVVFIRIVGTHNTANVVFHCVHFECPAQVDDSGSSLSSKSALTLPSSKETHTSQKITAKANIANEAAEDAETSSIAPHQNRISRPPDVTGEAVDVQTSEGCEVLSDAGHLNETESSRLRNRK